MDNTDVIVVVLRGKQKIDCFCEMLVIFDLLKYMILFHGKVSLLPPSTIGIIIVAGVHNNLTVLQRRVVR